jgi:hypothetical protein
VEPAYVLLVAKLKETKKLMYAQDQSLSVEVGGIEGESKSEK